MPELPPLINPLEKKEPQIHVIPDEFYGAAARAKIPAAPAPVAIAQPVQTAGGPPAATPVKTGSNTWVLIPIIAAVVLGGMGFAVWYFVLNKPAAKPPATTPTVTLPPAVVPPAPEPATTTEPTPAPAPAPAPEPATSTLPVAPTVAIDTDNDGLMDIEESLYGTDPNKSDSDSDGFSDSVEVLNLYNPAGFKPTTLIAAGLVATFDAKEGGYQIFYPTSWTPNDKGNGEVTFANAQNQPVAVTIGANPDNKSVLDWYLSANPTASPSQTEQFFTKSGAEGVRSPDGKTSYIAGKGKIYIITYTSETPASAYFQTTYKMMVNSFKLNP